MLIHKKQVEETTKALYKSSNILASSYNPTSKTLEIIFKKGTKYVYSDVDATAYMRFETAESQGQVLNSHIKKYQFTKLNDVDPSGIESMITSYQSANETNLMKEYAARVTGLLGEEVTKNTLMTIKDITEKTIAILEA
tara:strand:- start:62 stop:478 length:417 start_codon:yes stop_codon:yes gene_type:complete